MTDMTILHNQLVAAMRDLAAAQEEDEAADRAYDEGISRYEAQFKAEHPDLVTRARSASERLRESSAKVEVLRARAKETLTGSVRYDDLPEGFKQTRDKQFQYDPDEMVQAAMKYAPFLLVVDEKRLDKFLSNLVEDHKTHFTLPEYIKMWLPVSVTTGYKSSISDATLRKLRVPEAPVSPPGVLKDGETTWVHITRWTRVEFEGRSTVWECATAEGYAPLRIMWESTDPNHRNDLKMLEDAEYGMISRMGLGESQSWTQHPVEACIMMLGSSWRLVSVTQRPWGATADTGGALPATEPLTTDVILNEDAGLDDSYDPMDEEAARIQEYDVAHYVREPLVREDPRELLESPPAKSATMFARIIGLKRGVTTNSQSPKWDCTTLKPVPKGLRIFSHEDAKKDSFNLFIIAGYDSYLDSMKVDEQQNWIDHPIEVQIAESDGGWWNVIAVTPRHHEAEPDGYALERLKQSKGLLNDDIPF